MDNANYHTPAIAIDLTKDNTDPAIKPQYFVEFVSAPTHLKFILDKKPQFKTLGEAFAFLHHYEDEFAAYGHVYSRFGLEPDPRNTPQDKPFNDEDIPQ